MYFGCILEVNRCGGLANKSSFPNARIHMAACIIAIENKLQTQCKLYYIAIAAVLRSFILGQSCNRCYLKFTIVADSNLVIQSF